jgi:hypothetical protein
MEVTSLVSLVDGEVEVLRQGMGDTAAFQWVPASKFPHRHKPRMLSLTSV